MFQRLSTPVVPAESIMNRATLTTAYAAYLDMREREALVPEGNYLPYDFAFLNSRKWRNPLGFEMVAHELQELTNILNHWRGSLRRWDAWNRVLASYSDESTAWEVRREFLEPLAHECQLRPSSVRDTITSVATNALHQARMSTDPSYRDLMEGDSKHPGQNAYLSRAKKEKRLRGIASLWHEGIELYTALLSMDCKAYKAATFDYRNLSSHTIAPRLGIGVTRTVTRAVLPAYRMVEGPGGQFNEVAIPNKMSVWYVWGGTEPLNLSEARAKNEEQFHQATFCYGKYLAALQAALTGMEPK